MKKFKALIPAFLMLLLSAALLGTSTFAWFSMNNRVEVNNLQITADTNSTYLLISKTQTTASGIQSEGSISVAETVTSANAKVYPSAYEITDASDFATVGNWYTGNSNDPANYQLVNATKTALTTFDHYVIHNTYYITVAAGSAPATDLIVSAYDIASNGTATGSDTTFESIKTVVVCGSNYEEFDSTDTAGSVTLYTSNITDSTVVTVDVYIYMDGNNTTVYTNNFENLDGAAIGLTFSVTPAAV